MAKGGGIQPRRSWGRWAFLLAVVFAAGVRPGEPDSMAKAWFQPSSNLQCYHIVPSWLGRAAKREHLCGASKSCNLFLLRLFLDGHYSSECKHGSSFYM